MISYHEICTLIPTYDLEDFPTDLEESKAESILNCFAVMWHPLLLADARQLPTWRRLESEPAIFEGRLVLVPTACDWISADFAERVLDVGGTVIEGLVTREEWLEAIRTVTAKGEPTLYKRPLRHEHDHDYIHDEGHAPEQSGTDLIIQTLSQLKSEEPSEATEDDPDNANESSAIAEESSEKELPADPLAKLSPEIERDFLALGFAYLQTELLSRQMHHFSSVDEIALRLAVTRAAKSALEGDDIAARMGLNRAFELLHDVREIFFPVESYLIDLCLLTPEADADRLTQICERAKLKPAPSEGEEEGPLPGTGKAHPVNFMLNAKELSELAEKQPAACETLSETWKLGKIDFCGGEQVDRPSMLAPMESVLWNFQEGHATWEGILKQRPKMWSRRRFGFSTLLPMLLNRFGYRSAFHFALDDGLYPDTEHTRFKWEGVDYTPIEACSRIPMAADSAASFLKFPQRLAESMQSDNVAGVILARYPEEKTPWMEDLRRIAAYAPIFGRFVTWAELFSRVDHYSKEARYSQREYLSPVLIQRVAYERRDALSQFATHFERRSRFTQLMWLESIYRILLSKPLEEERLRELEAVIEGDAPVSELPPPASWGESPAEVESESETTEASPPGIEDRLEEGQHAAINQLAAMLSQGKATEAGSLLFNNLPHSRRTVLFWPDEAPLPEINDVIRATQEGGPQKVVVVDLPASGYAWNANATTSPPELPELRFPAVEDNILRNEFFEVHMNPATGGIAKIKGLERSPARLSQQVAYRFPREQEYVMTVDGEEEEVQSHYSEPVCRRMELTAAGPVMNEITTETDLYDPVRSLKLARVTQRTRVYRGCKFIDVEFELDITQMPLADPWNNYYCIRFAWNDPTAAVTRSIQHAGFNFEDDRFESTEYIEISSDEELTTLLMPGLPFHRAHGERMLDTLLVAGKEQQRKFQFRIVLDEPSAAYALANYTQPPILLTDQPGPPASGQSAWFFHFNTRHVQLLRFLPAVPPKLETEQEKAAAAQLKYGFTMRVMETSGRKHQLQIMTYRPVKFARQRDFNGRTITQLVASKDGVSVYLSPYEVAEIEIWFG